MEAFRKKVPISCCSLLICAVCLCWTQGSLLSLEGLSTSCLLAFSISEVAWLQETDRYEGSRRVRGIGASPAQCVLYPSPIWAALARGSRGRCAVPAEAARRQGEKHVSPCLFVPDHCLLSLLAGNVRIPYMAAEVEEDCGWAAELCVGKGTMLQTLQPHTAPMEGETWGHKPDNGNQIHQK